jgi:hypothetical protein
MVSGNIPPHRHLTGVDSGETRRVPKQSSVTDSRCLHSERTISELPYHWRVPQSSAREMQEDGLIRSFIAWQSPIIHCGKKKKNSYRLSASRTVSGHFIHAEATAFQWGWYPPQSPFLTCFQLSILRRGLAYQPRHKKHYVLPSSQPAVMLGPIRR